MTIEEFEGHLKATSFQYETSVSNGTTFVVIKNVPISGGAHVGKVCDVGIIHSTANPWVPHPSVHVRPHLVPMGQRNSQASALGGDWQYLSRRFDRPPTAKNFLAHILTVLGEF